MAHVPLYKGGRIASDDEVLAEAERIRALRRNEKRLKSFEEKEEVMIRWDNPDNTVGESYTSVVVPKDAVAEIVRTHFTELIKM